MSSRRAWSLLGAAALAGCSGVQSPFNPAGEQSERLFSLLGLMLAVCGSVYLLVLGFLAWAIWRARGPLSRAEGPALAPDDRALDRSLAVWIGVMLVGLTALVLGSLLADRGFAAARERDALQVRVTGHQWWWRIAYRDPRGPGGWIETANELHLPAGRTARVELGSADVIHSFWVPNVAGKTDVIPGHANVSWLTPHRLGWFRGECAEFCGFQHAHMAFDVKVETPAQFEAWLVAQAQPAASPADVRAARGEAIPAQRRPGARRAVPVRHLDDLRRARRLHGLLGEPLVRRLRPARHGAIRPHARRGPAAGRADHVGAGRPGPRRRGAGGRGQRPASLAAAGKDGGRCLTA